MPATGRLRADIGLKVVAMPEQQESAGANVVVELERFRVLPGMGERVTEWLDFLNANLPAVLETMEGERMLVESIFSEAVDGVDYLYWYSVQLPGGSQVEQSDHWLDKKHMEYWEKCIDPEYGGQKLATRVVMFPGLDAVVTSTSSAAPGEKTKPAE